ncbi:CAAX prenyl protease-related protein [Aquabacterium sp.]|uniref:CAAX prenyl protease-related protein n=1 Tax=Aquabacterium sp. TaxID=1872578 RepID=UPI0025BF9912|nr:CAAX prenyl protease-related protein [Aquabacterium sp.]
MDKLLSPAAWARVIPFALFMALLALRGQLPSEGGAVIDARWVYALSVLVVGGALAFFWRRYGELARPLSGPRLTGRQVALSVAVGLIVFELWIHLAEPWMMLGRPTASFRPVDADGQLQWGLIAFRWVGAALLVPVMEELFWRSFLMRWVDRPDFESVDPGAVSPKAVALSSLVFMLAHTQWLAAIVAGLAYAWLYRYTRSLWAPILAHAVTNGVLGIWVVFYGNWMFW